MLLDGDLLATHPAGVAAGRSVKRSLAWLLESGIEADSGGCHAWYDPSCGYQMLYPEVTGYCLTLCEWTGGLAEDLTVRCRDNLLSSAGRFAEWLRALILPEGGVPCLISGDAIRECPDAPGAARPGGSGFAQKAQRRYTFDAGIVLQSLVALARRTSDGPTVDAARALADWLCGNQRRDGTFVPFLGPEPWRSSQADWSTRPGCHQAKVGIGLLALAEMTGDEVYRATARRAASAVLARQQPDGRFLTNPLANTTNIHPHCYAAEAAWAVGTALDDGELLGAAARATRWVLDVSPRGQALRIWRPAPATTAPARNPRVDGLAQMLRLAVLTGEGSREERAALTATLLEYQEDSEDARRDGGFRFGHLSTGHELPHVNVWVTAFAVQALWLASRAAAMETPTGRDVLDWRYLV